MVVTTFPETRHPSTSLEPSTGDLVLRVRNGLRDGQTVRLRSTKCTIGGGAACTLRLRARGVAPLHCLILRGPTSTIVRRWAPDTRLNDRAFTDSPLSPGDRLSIGPIELEVVAMGDCSASVRPPVQESSRRHAEIDAETKRQQKALQEDRRQLDVLAAELDRRQETLMTEAARIEAQRAQFETEHAAWQAEQAAARQKLDERQRELPEKLAALESQQKAWADERRQWDVEREASSAQAAAREEQFHTQLAEFEVSKKELEHLRRQWQAEQTEREEQLNARRQELDARQAELDARQSELDEERQRMDREAQDRARRVEPSPEPEEAEFHEPSEAPPVDLADVFRRIGANVDLEDNEPEPAVSEVRRNEQPVQREAPAPRSAASPATASESDDEESIDDYMSRLMQRIGSTGGSGAIPPPAAVRPSRAKKAEPEPTPQIEAAKPEAPFTPIPSKLAPRAVAPETSTDITALRELANLTAKSAIGQHSRGVLISRMRSKLIVAVVGLITGIALLWMWKTLSTSQMAFYSSLMALLVTIYWGVEYALLTGRLIISKSGHIDIDWNSPFSAHAHAAPTEHEKEHEDANASAETESDEGVKSVKV